MKKAAPSQKQSSPTRLQLTPKHYCSAILGALDSAAYGALTLTLASYVLEVLP